MRLTKKEKQAIFEKEEAQRKAKALQGKKTTTREQDIKILKGENIEQPIVEQPIVEQPIVEQPIVEQPIVEQPIVEQPIVEQPIVENKPDLEKRPLSLWDELSKPTNEDLGIKDQVKNAAGSIKNFANEASEKFNNITDLEAEQLAQKTSYKVKAGIVVELCDVAFMVICLLLTWNFDDDNQKKFTLNNERKNAIKFNLQKVYELEGKKITPKKDIAFLIIGSYVPMLLVAVFVMINKLKRSSEEKKNKAAFTFQQIQQQKETDILKNQLAAMQYEKEILQRELDFKTPVKNNHIKKEFIKVPEIGRIKKQAAKVSTGPGRGVKAGVKRGSYKKLNK